MNDELDISAFVEEDFDELEDESVARQSRPADQRLPAIIRQFVASGKPKWRVNYVALERKYGGVAQDLRRLLKDMKTDDGVPYFNLAQVSVKSAEKEIWLKRRPDGWTPPEGGERRGRPKGSGKAT